MPVAEFAAALPVRLTEYPLAGKRCGLIAVDEVHGFCTPGAGALAPQGPNPQVSGMIAETDRLARRFLEEGWPVLAFLDTHEPGVPEPPYPPHCERGSGEENLVDDLAWLDGAPGVTLIRKDCINGYVGAIDRESHDNRLLAWLAEHRIEALVVTGICTDICVLDLVLTLLSARNHKLTGELKDIVVFEPATATYDLPIDAARAQGLPETAAHPQAETHHVGLYVMASRGAVLADRLVGLA